MKSTLTLLTALLLAPLITLHATEPPLNVLLITADDLGYEAMDFLDAKVPGVTLNLSKFAAEGLSFLRLAALTPLAAAVTFPTLAPTWKTIPLIEA